VSDVPILVCPCGKRLRAPGARPGRVGRCPSCGGELRVPEEAPAAAEPVEETPPPRPRKAKRKSAGAGSTAIWDGLVKAPGRPEEMRESLLYPLWGATGVAVLVILPPLLCITSVPVVTMAQALMGRDSPFRIGAVLVLVGFGVPLACVLGYALLFLGGVVSSSAAGEMHHPRWPDFEPSSILSGLGRWAWAGLVGGVVGGFPAAAYWVYCGDVDLFDVVILGELTALGATYALMALLASVLHEDARAANPLMVCSAIVRVGWAYATPCLLAGAAVVVAATVGLAAFEVSNTALSAFLFWLFWVVALYEAMVVLRVLGLFYRAHARELGWFRDRTGWGA
jgi:hypothetical protein